MFDKDFEQTFFQLDVNEKHQALSFGERSVALDLLLSALNHVLPQKLEALSDQEFDKVWQEFVNLLGSMKSDLPDTNDRKNLEDFYIGFCPMRQNESPGTRAFSLLKQ